ncbi:MAG: hypothetical protein JHC31_13310 [Sulfurihydrogenibium sp.]|jgi:hypothetical protein|nr:hypothetical protein [Sulfurihydrogenibium sp.]
MALSAVLPNTFKSLNSQKIIYAIANIDELYDTLSYFNNAYTHKAITYDHIEFHIHPKRKKGRDGKAIAKIHYIVSTYWLSQIDSSFEEWLLKQSYYEKVEEIKVSTHLNLFSSNIKKHLSFFIHIDNLSAINRYIDSIIKNRPLSSKSEICIEIDLDNKKLIINREFKAKIIKVKT